MNISRRHLTGRLPALGLLAVGLLGAGAAQAMTADEEAVAKRLEEFRSAQVAADAKAFDELCAAELSYSHSDAHIEDKATFIKNATAGKSKFLVLEYKDPCDPRGRRCRDRTVPLGGRERSDRRRQEKLHQPSHPDELAKTGRRLETAVPRVHQALTVATWMARLGPAIP